MLSGIPSTETRAASTTHALWQGAHGIVVYLVREMGMWGSLGSRDVGSWELTGGRIEKGRRGHASVAHRSLRGCWGGRDASGGWGDRISLTPLEFSLIPIWTESMILPFQS